MACLVQRGLLMSSSSKTTPGRSKDAVETLLGVLVAEETELLKAARFLVTQSHGDIAAVLSEAVIPKLTEQINALRGDRPMSSDCKEFQQDQSHQAGRERTGPENSFAAECLPGSLTSHLADFYADIARAMINHQILHALALSSQLEILAGIAWSHANELNALLHGGVRHLADATVRDFGDGNPATAAAATEQMERIWTHGATDAGQRGKAQGSMLS